MSSTSKTIRNKHLLKQPNSPPHIHMFPIPRPPCTPTCSKSSNDYSHVCQVCKSCHTKGPPNMIANPLSDLSPPEHPRTDMFPDPANDSMEHMFSPLRQQWVWDFFFESDHQEADMLQYAITDQFVVLADFHVATNETPDPYANSFRVGEKHRILLLPSFSTGSLSVGFGVNERITSSTTFACRERYTGRIVRDDQTCTVLFIAEDYNINMVEVSFFSLRSPTHREHNFLIFHREKFRDAIQSIRTQYNHKAVKESLMYYYHATEGRPCPTCGLQNCYCRLTITPKRHPLDRESELMNLNSYVGHYGGVASLGLYSKGTNLFLARYNATSAMKLNGDFSTQQKLALWALCAAAQKRPVNPMKLIMSEAANMKNRVVTATDTFLLASLAEAVVEDDEQPEAAMTSASNMLADGIPAPGVGVGGALAQVSAMAGAGGFDINAMFGDACQLTAGGDLDFIPVVEEFGDVESSNPVSTAPSLSDGTHSGEGVNGRDIEMTLSSASGVSRSQTPIAQQPVKPTVQTQATPVSQAQLGIPVPEATQPPVPPTIQPGNGGKKPQERKPTARPLLPLAPAGGPESTQDEVSAELDERKRKAELRKARNRESAQRSNLKRKMQIQKLKEEIDAASTRESYLRAKEKMLREENLTLRTAVFR